MTPRAITRPVLRVHDLCAGWGRRPVLNGVSFAVRPGERVGLLGPNGAGKTTLFDALAGRLRVRSGKVLLEGDDVTGLSPHRLARRGLGYVPQGPSVFVDISVRANLEAAIGAPAARRSLGPGAVEDALCAWGLVGVADRAAGVLSGGERRRLEVARSLLLEPAVLLLDEPFAGLDPAGRRALRDGLAALPRSTALLITDHAADDVLATCTRILLLVDGTLIVDVPSADFVPDLPEHRRYFGA
jgi:lipopolysaccharide export system ATP-binding protein